MLLNKDTVKAIHDLMNDSCQHIQAEEVEGGLRFHIDTVGALVEDVKAPRWVLHHRDGDIDVTHCPHCGAQLPTPWDTSKRENPHGSTSKLIFSDYFKAFDSDYEPHE